MACRGPGNQLQKRLSALCANVFPKMIIKRLRLLRSVIRMEKFFSFGEGHSVVCYKTRPPIEAEMCLRHPQMGLFGTASTGAPIFRL
jgi:hypothetical protein